MSTVTRISVCSKTECVLWMMYHRLSAVVQGAWLEQDSEEMETFGTHSDDVAIWKPSEISAANFHSVLPSVRNLGSDPMERGGTM